MSGTEQHLIATQEDTEAEIAPSSDQTSPLVSLAAIAIAKIGTKSLGGAALVSAGLIGKALYDRAQARKRKRPTA